MPVYPDPSLAGGLLTGVPRIIRRTADSAARNSGNTGTTLTADDTLLVPVGAAEMWLIEGILIVGSVNVTMDIKVNWTVPSGGTLLHGVVGSPSSNTPSWSPSLTGNTPNALQTTAAADQMGTANSQALGMQVRAMYDGSAGAAGSVTLTWAQVTSDAGNLVMKANSLLMAWRIA